VVVTGVLAGIVLWLAQRLENAVLKWRPQVQLG
jgi:hypothetical protein